MSLFSSPINSPWGPIQHSKTLCPGAFEVDTASHGGIMVNIQVKDALLSPEAQRYGFQEGIYLCFEEDCDALVALRELMDKGLFTAPVNEYFKPGEYSQVIDRSLRRWHPEYWATYVQSQRKPSVKGQLSKKLPQKNGLSVNRKRKGRFYENRFDKCGQPQLAKPVSDEAVCVS